MKPILVVGLGNSAFGDDGIGCALVPRLARDRSLRKHADFVVGGGDLLRVADRFEGRERVVIVDAALGDETPGTVSVHEEPFDGLTGRWEHAHHPSAVEAVALLKAASPALRSTRFTFVLVTVRELRHEATLSTREIAGRVRDVLGALSRSAEAARRSSSR
jgi:hydrogenase maturation protease